MTIGRPPGPTGAALARTLVDYARDPLAAFTRLAREHGDIVQFMSGPMSAFLVNHPDHVEDVLVNQLWNFVPARVLVQRRLSPQGIIMSQGYTHQHSREMLAPVYDRERVTRFASVIPEAALRAAERWQSGLVLDVQAEKLPLTVSVSAETLFGPRVREDPDELSAWAEICAYVSTRSTYPWGVAPEYLPFLPDNRRFWRAKRYIDEAVLARIAERRISQVDDGDLLGLLLRARHPEDDRSLTDNQILDEVITAVAAGAPFTAQTLAWTWYLLSQHPAAEARLHDEIDSLLSGARPVYADVARLAYTQMVLKESMRLYPAVWLLGRQAVTDYQTGRYRIPAGSLVALSPYVMQRDERFFPEPTRFDPERWTDEATAARPEFSFFPLSGGPQGCIGRPWAWTTMVLLLATLAQRWRMRLEPDQSIDPQPLFALRARRGINMRLDDRAASR